MNTAETLEAMTDASSFERLTTSVLRKAITDYSGLLHPGVNSKGRTRKSWLDIYGVVRGSNPVHFLLGEHTTTSKLKSLEDKWLHDPSKVKRSNSSQKREGDLLKICQKIEQLRKRYPEAKFTIILTTNLLLTTTRDSEDLIDKVYTMASKFGISPSDIDIWEQSRIADFLNSTSEGQWLRKEHLHLEAEILSEKLLRNLCNKSLEQYKKPFLTSPDRWVSRHIYHQVEKAVENQNCSISLLIGNSGSGKSAAAYQVAKKYLEEGGYSLWLSENVLGSSDSLENALDKALHDLYPSLMSDAGNAALKLLKDGKRLLLIADDVNRTNSPANLLQKLINWSKPFPRQDSNAKTTPSNQLLICPVWSDIVRKINLDVDKTTWISSVFVGTMSSEEGLEIVKDALLRNRIKLPNAEVTTLAEKLGNDPILIGLFDDLLPKIEYGKLSQVAENAIDSFISEVIENVVGDLFPIEYRSALLGLTTQMLLQRRFNPKWFDIQNWISNSSGELQALRVLAKNEKLCRLEGEKLVFRHDRIREFLLVESMGQLLNENASEPLDIFWEPYYAEIIGQAIIQYPQSEEFLQKLCAHLPLALVESLNYSNTSENYLKIVDIVENWLCRNIENDAIPESLINGVYTSLMKVGSPCILKITETLPYNQATLLARLRNGCTKSGIRYLAHSNINFFVPLVQDSLYEEILSYANFYHKATLLTDLQQVLKSTSIKDIKRDGALTLAGFLKSIELEKDIITCWQLSEDKSFTLRSALWAATQCFRDKYLYLLEPLFAYWSELPDEPNEKHKYARNWFADGEISQLILSHQLRSSVIKYFLSQSKKYKSLSLIIAEILSKIDDADLLEYIVRESSFPNVWTNVHLWWNRNLSKLSMDRLKELWQNDINNETIREKAASLWFVSVSHEQIDDLRAIKADSPYFYSTLLKRIKLGDQSVIEDAYSLLLDDVNLLYQSHYIWCNQLMAIFEKHLQSLENIITKDFTSQNGALWILSGLITLIPINDAEVFLVRYWSYLGYTRNFVQAALYIGTPKCMKLADASIQKCSNHDLVFKNIAHFFTFESQGRQSPSVDHVKRLLPYYDYLNELELHILETICQKYKAFEWGSQHLKTRHRKSTLEEYYPSDNQLLQELDDLSNHEHGIYRVLSWAERLEQRHIIHQEALTLLESWLASNPTIQNYRIVCECLKLIGSRQNLSLLEKYEIVSSPTEVSQIKMDTQFTVYRRTLE